MKRSFAMKSFKIVLAVSFLISGLAIHMHQRVSANRIETEIPGKHYIFGEDDDFSFSGQNGTLDSMFGSLKISGADYTVDENNGYTNIAINKDYVEEDVDYNLDFTYSYNSNPLLNDNDNQWHVFSSKSDEIDNIELDGKIKKGALVLQISRDNLNWYTQYERHNILEEDKYGIQSFYQTLSLHLVNGCYYRVVVVYELERDDYDDQRHMEIFEFFAYDEIASKTEMPSSNKRYRLGETVKCDESDGYYGIDTMDRDDPHYGWELGKFFVGGYTEYEKQGDTVIFLKNSGDQASLWFELEQNINALNGDDDVFIKPDPSGYDKEFGTPTIDFGRGALIIRKTDHENVKGTPQIYVNYLEANAAVGSSTKVDLFEEGDYEVALDYEIKYGETTIPIIGTTISSDKSFYRIAFRFSVRNANCMFYPRDCVTKSELHNDAIAPNGFYIDLAGSKYLKTNVIREVLADGAMGLSEDTRFNRATRDGEEFKEEGIYTITVTNQYTDLSTTKRIYVGENEILKAYMVTGLSISEIKEKLNNGATIDDDGNIIDPEPVPESSETTSNTTPVETTVAVTSTRPSESTYVTTTTAVTETSLETNTETETKLNSNPFLIILFVLAGGGIVVLVGCLFYRKVYRTKNKSESIPRLTTSQPLNDSELEEMNTIESKYEQEYETLSGEASDTGPDQGTKEGEDK